MYPSHSYINETKYYIRPSVVQNGQVSKIRIYPAEKNLAFCDTDAFELRILPKDYSEPIGDGYFSQLGTEKQTKAIDLSPKDGVISFEYRFYGCQEWIIYLRKKDDNEVEWYWTDSFPETRASLSIFCLTDDLYGRIPMKGDLHIHTTLSDGKETPEYNVAAYREAGFDFISITDHHRFSDGKSLTEYFSFANPLIVLPGEEIHEKEDAVIHTVCIGGDRSISDLLQNRPQRLAHLLEEAKEKYTVPNGLYEREYLLRAVIYEQIKKSGGYAILPHPFWQLPERFNADTRMSTAVLENGIADAFEVFGGCTPEGNDLQVSLFYSLKNRNLSVVASSDSHTVSDGITAFGEIFTLAFVKDLNIIKSISDRKSVAVYCAKGESPRIVGDLTLAKFAHFLLRAYFPTHDHLCKMSGALLKRYLAGDADVKKQICEAEEKIKNFEGEFLGYDLLY